MGGYLWKQINYWLDADMSGELILGELLSREKGILTEKWFYSTELRVLNTQIIFKIFFYFFESWHTVRWISSIVLILIMLGSFYYLMKQLNCKGFPFIAACLILNPSTLYFDVVLKGLYYIPHICISFLTIGMIIQYMKTDNILLKKILFFIMTALSLISGLGGLRQIVILYLPLLIVSILWKILGIRGNVVSGKWNILCEIMFLGSMLGYLINIKVLSKRFIYKKFTEIEYKDFELDSVTSVFNGILHTLGYRNGNIFSVVSVINVGAIALLVLILISLLAGLSRRCRISNTNRFLSFYFLCALLVFTLLYSFTNMEYSNRYNVPFLVFSVPVIFLNIQETEFSRNIKKCLYTIILISIYFGGLYQWNFRKNIDTTSQIKEVSEYLLSHEVSKGYSTFWNGNVLTELSDGEIEVWVHSPTGGETNIWENTDEIYPWLQYTDHVNNRPRGKVFVLLSKEEYDALVENVMAEWADVAFSNDTYVLFVFDDYDDLQRSVARG